MNDDDDELPPWLSERLRDATESIYRSATEHAQDENRS